MAVTDMGLSSHQFWRLTWWEWGMLCVRLYKQSKIMQAQRELSVELTRNFMCLYANAHSKKPYTPKDFLWALSYDKPTAESVKPSLEVFEDLVKRHGKVRKKNGKH